MTYLSVAGGVLSGALTIKKEFSLFARLIEAIARRYIVESFQANTSNLIGGDPKHL